MTETSLSDSKTHSVAIVIKIVSWAQKHIHRLVNRENRSSPTNNTQLIVDKGAKAIQWKKDSLSKIGAGANGYLQEKNKKLHLNLTSYRQFNSK